MGIDLLKVGDKLIVGFILSALMVHGVGYALTKSYENDSDALRGELLELHREVGRAQMNSVREWSYEGA
ncbi:hypothetical protein F7U66_11135 [Vibrio parahaemolyticus]|nr:hypothetical protein [Vibrio parahaemolyticus]